MNAPRNGAGRDANAARRNEPTSLDILLGLTARGRFIQRVRSVSALHHDAEISAAEQRGDHAFAFALEDRRRDVRAFVQDWVRAHLGGCQ